MLLLFYILNPYILKNIYPANISKHVCESKDLFCKILISSEVNKILEFSQYQTSDKAPFIIYADHECLIEKIDGCRNNSKNWSATTVGEPNSSVFQCLQHDHLKA